MANTFKFGNGEWAVGKETVLAYNDENNNFKPLPFSFDRASTATVVNKDGLIETVGVDEPRIDFLNNTKGHLLLEPSRQNKLLQSNQFDTTWVLSSSITLTSGQTGVGGSSDAWLLKRNSTGSRYVQQALSLSSATYSYSVYLKAESTNWAYVWSYDGVASVNAYFDLENGVVGNTGGSNLDSATIESIGNGWYRCILTYTQPTTLVRIYPAYSDGSISTGTDNGIYIQYAQLEEGSYATSYIPTSGSAVTRSAETAEINSVPNVPTSYPFVMYVEGKHTLGQESGTCGFYDKSNQYYYYSISFESNNKIQAESRPQGIQNILTSTSTYTDGFHKVAVLFLNDTTIKLYVDGELEGTKTDCSSNSFNTSFTDYVIGVFRSISTNSCNIKDFRIFNHELTDTELKNLTI